MGHPDKLCDQVSDAILDAYLLGDRHSRVACETLVKTGFVVVAGEVTSRAVVDIQPVVRQTILDHGDAAGIHATAVANGTTSMHEDGLRKALAGITSVEEVERVTREA